MTTFTAHLYGGRADGLVVEVGAMAMRMDVAESDLTADHHHPALREAGVLDRGPYVYHLCAKAGRVLQYVSIDLVNARNALRRRADTQGPDR